LFNIFISLFYARKAIFFNIYYKFYELIFEATVKFEEQASSNSSDGFNGIENHIINRKNLPSLNIVQLGKWKVLGLPPII
jgi:hypothetical protein